VAALAEADATDAAEPHRYSAQHLMRPNNAAHGQQVIDQWLAEGVMLHDPLPAIYPYVQSFESYGGEGQVRRIGFLALVHVGHTTIYPHEAVLPHSVDDRLRVLAQNGLQSIPTHGLYEDADFLLERMTEQNLGYPLAEVIDSHGVVHTLGRYTDLKLVQRCMDVLRNRPLFLADGHHRYQTFLKFREQYLEQHPHTPDDHPVHFHLMYLSNFQAPDLRIWPFHRVLLLPDELSARQALEGLQQWFRVEDTDRRTPLFTELQQHPAAIVLIAGSRVLRLHLRPDIDPQTAIDLPLHRTVKELPYAWLHYFAFDRVLGWPYSEQSRRTDIQYYKSMGAAVAAAQSSSRSMAFLMPEVTPAQMQAVCTSGALMPQKSTYFYPKVQGGLVFHRMELG
jgi:uncharacterized protein (DUF1015 family)